MLYAYRAPPEIARPPIGMVGLLTTPSFARFCSTHPRPRPTKAGSNSERALPGPSPGLRLGGSSGHWEHVGAPGDSIESDPVRPRLYSGPRAGTRARARAREKTQFSGANDLGALSQIRGACRLCGTHQRLRRLVGVDQIPNMGHLHPQLFGQHPPV